MEGTLELVTTERAPNLDTIARVLDVTLAVKPYQDRLDAVFKDASTLTVTDASEREKIERCFQVKKDLAAIRLDGEDARLVIVKEPTQFVSDVNTAFRKIRKTIETLEDRMVEQANFAQRQLADQKERLQREREEKIGPFVENAQTMLLADMTAADFDLLLEMSEYKFNRKLDDERAERKAQVERDHLAAETQKVLERLKKEAEDREKAIETERQATAKATARAQQAEAAKGDTDAEMAKIRADSKRILADLKAKSDQEDEAKFAAATATDREKLLSLATTIRATEFPKLTPANQSAMDEIIGGVGRMAAYIEKRAKEL